MTTIINNRYRMDALIGEGGMGGVYRTYDRLTRDFVALKRVNISDSSYGHNGQENQYRMTVLANEFRALAGLRHPNIISVLDYGFDETGNPFLTMELLDGAQEINHASVDRPHDVITNYLIGILQALRYLHQRGILHRDLKPSNVLVDNDISRLLDFGLATELGSVTAAAETMGTLAYMAPEVLGGKPPSIEADLYAFGLIAYEMYVGHHPYPFETQTELIHQILLEPPSLLEDRLPGSLADVIYRLLAKDPLDRYHSALDALRAFCEATGTPLPPETQEIRESYLVASTFVGRSQELEKLDQALQEMHDSHGSAWLIGGESGVGKTRLMDELRSRALVQGVTVLRGQAVTEAGFPYYVLRSIIPQLLLIVDVDDDEAAILQLLVPDIATLLERDIARSTVKPQDVQQRLPFIVSDLVARASEHTSLLILIEDLQWAPDSMDVINALIACVATRPVMIVGNYRSDEAPYLMDTLQGAQGIRLERLGEEEIRRLSTAMLGDAGSSDSVVELIQRESEGNAFFMVEVVRTLAEEVGRLSDIGLTTLPAQVFTGGIQKIVQRRLDKLPDWALHPLRISAVIGRQVNQPLLQDVLPALDMQRWLTICNEVAIFAANGTEWQFSHDKIREHVLADIHQDERKQINLQIAGTIEREYNDVISDYAALLAELYRQAQALEKEVRYAYMAARALRDFNPREAYHFARRTLDLQQQIDQTARVESLGDLHLLIGDLAIQISDYSAARSHLHSALTVFAQTDDELGVARAKCSLGDLGYMTSQFTDAIPYLEDSLPILEQYKEWRYLAYANMNMAAIQNQLHNREEAHKYSQRCLEVAEQLGDDILIGKALNNLGIYHDMSGDLDRAQELHNRALSIRRRIKDKRGIASSLVNLGFLEASRGNIESQKEHLLESLANIRMVGNASWEANILNILGQVETQLKNLPEALNCFELSLAIAERIGDYRFQTLNLINLAKHFEHHPDLSLRYLLDAARRVQVTDLDGLKVQVVTAMLDHGVALKDTETAVKIIAGTLARSKDDETKAQLEARLSNLKTRIDGAAYEAARSNGSEQSMNKILSVIISQEQLNND